MAIESPFFDVKETAMYLNIPLFRAFLAVKGTKFPAIQIGNRWRVYKDKLDEWAKKIQSFYQSFEHQ